MGALNRHRFDQIWHGSSEYKWADSRENGKGVQIYISPKGQLLGIRLWGQSTVCGRGLPDKLVDYLPYSWPYSPILEGII
jgi:hypothetical protein